MAELRGTVTERVSTRTGLHCHGRNGLHLSVQSFVKDVEDLGLHDATTDRCRVSAKIGLPEDVKMPAWLKAYNKVLPIFKQCIRSGSGDDKSANVSAQNALQFYHCQEIAGLGRAAMVIFCR